MDTAPPEPEAAKKCSPAANALDALIGQAYLNRMAQQDLERLDVYRSWKKAGKPKWAVCFFCSKPIEGKPWSHDQDLCCSGCTPWGG